MMSDNQLEATGPYVPVRSFVAPSPNELSSRLPNLEVTELLGHGGMGVVYKGRQPYLDRNVAIKVVRPDVADGEEAQQRFIREARSLAKLVHPYIVTVFDFGKVDDLCYLVMEYIEGSSLRQLIAKNNLSRLDVRDFSPQISEALQYAHESGVVHCDIKPDNILVDRRNRVRLVDFGLSRLLGSRAAQSPDSQRVAGTRGYMAPEQFSAPESVDHRADIYSTGVVLFEMLTGKIPQGKPTPPSATSASDPRLDPIVLRAMEHERERRYQQMLQMNADLIAANRTPESNIRLEQSVAAPIEKVFAAFTQPEEMAKWWAPSDDYTTPVAEAQPQVGGNFKIGMKHKDKNHTNLATGQFCRVEAPTLLKVTWAWETPKVDMFETELTLEFRPDGSSTNVTLFHDRFRDEGRRLEHIQGWTGCLDRLARKLSS